MAKKGFLDEISDLLKVLSHPIRLKILVLCTKREFTSRELREHLGISKPLLISHLKKLVSSGFLEYRVELDEEKMVIRKFYKTKEFEICVNKEMFLKMGKGL